MEALWSQSEEALRDTLVHKAERGAFNRIAAHYGFDRLQSISEAAWRGGLTTVAYNARDIFPVVFEALYYVLSDFIEHTTVTINPAEPNKLFFDAPVSAAYIGRYIRIDGVTYYTTNIENDSELVLSPYKTSYWAAAAFDVESETEVEIEIIPFVVYERGSGPTYTDPNGDGDTSDSWNGATYTWVLNNTLEIEVYPHIAFVPESYLQEPTEYLTASPGTCPADGGDVCTPYSMPNGGYLLDTDVDDLDVGIDVAYPVYLIDGSVSYELEHQIDRLLVAGNHINMYATTRTWVEAPSTPTLLAPLMALDFSLNASPFVNIVAQVGVGADQLDFSLNAEPFIGVSQ